MCCRKVHLYTRKPQPSMFGVQQDMKSVNGLVWLVLYWSTALGLCFIMNSCSIHHVANQQKWQSRGKVVKAVVTRRLLPASKYQLLTKGNRKMEKNSAAADSHT
ncbi:unnamed protein product [Orchesella dallaii]|uniref:Uncharacterized protein n=1 Tax=Orchesella dallaii TaxID=48710 RepID=A0ABP1QC74_9HEXA